MTYTEEEKEDAARALSACACDPFLGLSDILKNGPVRILAREAFFNAKVCPEDEFNWPIIYAEAEAMLRTGWSS